MQNGKAGAEARGGAGVRRVRGFAKVDSEKNGKKISEERRAGAGAFTNFHPRIRRQANVRYGGTNERAKNIGRRRGAPRGRGPRELIG